MGLKMQLKEIFKKKKKIVEKEYQENEKIEKFILKELNQINEEFFSDDDISKYWEVEISEDEFSIYYELGNIDFKDILQLSKIYKKHSFELYCITDNFTKKNKEKGIFFLFRRIDDDEWN